MILLNVFSIMFPHPLVIGVWWGVQVWRILRVRSMGL